MLFRFLLLLVVLCVGAHHTGLADDGYRLWLKYDQLPEARLRNAWQARAKGIILENGASPTLQTAAHELQLGLQGLLGRPVPVGASGGKGRIRLQVAADPTLGKEGYKISEQNGALVITGPTDAAVLYGCFALLRHVQTGQMPPTAALTSQPRIQYRMLNH